MAGLVDCQSSMRTAGAGCDDFDYLPCGREKERKEKKVR